MKKLIQYEHRGYMLYDSDLNENHFINSLNEIISLHTVFNYNLSSEKFEKIDYKFGEIRVLDQMMLEKEISRLKTQPLKKAMDVHLIFFNNNLRGFYYRFNAFLFDLRSVDKILKSLEKEYFESKYKQISSDYKEYLEKNSPINYRLKNKNVAHKKLLTFDDKLTAKIRSYMKEHDINTYKFISSALAIFFKVQGSKFSWMTEYLSEDKNLIGNINENISYSIQSGEYISDYMTSDLVEVDKFSSIRIEENILKDYRGDLKVLSSPELPYNMLFSITENTFDIVIEILFQKYTYKKDYIYMMMDKIRELIYLIVDEDIPVEDIDLMTSKELSVISNLELSDYKHQDSMYSKYQKVLEKNPSSTALSDDKNYTYADLDKYVMKFIKLFDKKSATGSFSLSELKPIEKLAAALAMDKQGLCFSENGAVLKKGLFSYKIKSDMNEDKGQFIKNDFKINNKLYYSYVEDIITIAKIYPKDVALMDNLYEFAIPVLCAGGRVSTNKKEVTIGFSSKYKKSFTKTFSKDKNSFFYLSYQNVLPMIIGYNNNTYSTVRAINGIGIKVLKKDKNPTYAFEKGDLYITIDEVDVNLNKKAMYYLDGNIKISK